MFDVRIKLNKNEIKLFLFSDKPEISALKTRRFHTLVSGAEANLECFLEANPIPLMVKWTKNGRELHGHSEKINDGKIGWRKWTKK